MAIAGAGGWIPSNRVRLEDGRLVFCAMTQNKPASVLVMDVDEAARRLLAGETITMDIREGFTSQLKEKLDGLQTG